MHSAGESVWRARVIDVVSAVPAAAAIQTPAMIDTADPQNRPPSSAFRFPVRNFLAGIGGNLMSLSEMKRGKTTFAVDG